MSNGALDRIVGSQYGIEEGWLGLAARYFDVEPSTSRAGLFGYVTSVLSHAAKNGVYHRALLYNEFFLNSMAWPSSIHSKATDLGVDVAAAVPARVPVLLRLDLAALREEGTGTAGSRTVNVPRADLQFRLEEVPYMLPYDLILEIESTGDSHALAQAKFDVDGPAASEAARELYSRNPFLRIVTAPDRGEAFARVDVWQMSRHAEEFDVLSDLISDQVLFEGSFRPQLAGRLIHYRPSETEPWRVIANHPAGAVPPDREREYAWWTQTDDGRYALTFPTLDTNFRPAFQSTIMVETFSTRGAAGNFRYSGSVGVVRGNRLRGILSATLPDGPVHSAGGEDRPTLLEMKTRILDAVRRTDLLVTEDDLSRRLRRIAGGRRMELTRERDDVVSRRFAAHLALEDDAGNVLGTRTEDVWIPESRLAAAPGGWSVLPAGTLARLNSATGRTEFYDTDLPPAAEAEWRTGPVDAYALPHAVRIRRGPDHGEGNVRVATADGAQWHATRVEADQALRFAFSSTEAESGIVFNNLRMERNPIEDPRLLVTAAARSLDDNRTMETARALVVLKDMDTLEVLGAADAAWDGLRGVFRGAVPVDDSTLDDAGGVSATLLNPDGGSGPVALPERFLAETVLMWRGAVLEGAELERAKARNSFFSTGLFATSVNSGPNPWRVAAVGAADEPWSLARDVSHAFSTTAANRSGSSVGAWLLGVPLLDHRLAYSSRRYAAAVRRMDAASDELRTALSLLKDQLEVSIRFMNTRGPSTRWTVSRVDLSMRIRVAAAGGGTREFEDRLRSFVAGFVAAHGEADRGDFSFSRMFAEMHNAVPNLASARLESLNGETRADMVDHYIRETSAWRGELPHRRVPELLSVRRVAADGNVELRPDIDIVYEETGG